MGWERETEIGREGRVRHSEGGGGRKKEREREREIHMVGVWFMYSAV